MYETLKKWVKDDLRAVQDHVRSYHSEGCCWAGAGECYTTPRVAKAIATMLRAGAWDEESQRQISLYNRALVQDIETAMSLETEVERMAPYYEAVREFDSEESDSKKEFAIGQFDWLVAKGFSKAQAARIMRAAGPGAVRAAVEWLEAAHMVLPPWDALDTLLCGSGGTNGFGRERKIAVLEAFGLPVPEHRSASGLSRILAGAREAVVCWPVVVTPAE